MVRDKGRIRVRTTKKSTTAERLFAATACVQGTRMLFVNSFELLIDDFAYFSAATSVKISIRIAICSRTLLTFASPPVIGTSADLKRKLMRYIRAYN